MPQKRPKTTSPAKSEGSDAPDVPPATPDAMKSDENEDGRKDSVARDDGDVDAELQMREKTEMAYALTDPEEVGESAATTAKRTVKNMNAEGVQDHANMVTRASPLLTGGEHTGLAQFERLVTFGSGVVTLPDETSIFRGGGIGGSNMFMRVPQGSALAPLMLDMQRQAQLKNAALKAAGESEVKLTVTVEADVRRFTVPRLDQGDWDKTVAIVIDTDMKETEIAAMMNEAAAAAHALDNTRPAIYIEESSGEHKLSRDIIAGSIPLNMASRMDAMSKTGKYWVLEDSAQVKIQTEEFYMQGSSSVRDVKVGGEGRTFILSTFGEVTEIYDIYVHDYDDLKNTGIYSVKLTIQAKYEEEFRCLVRRLAAKCENGPLRARYGKNVRGYVVTCTMHEAFEKAGLNPWDLAGKDAAQRQNGAALAGGDAMMEKATAAATEAAKAAAAISQREVDNKIKTSMEVAMVTQAKLDALAKAQVDAAEQTKVDKEAHRALIDEGIKTARAAQDAAEAAKRGASKAWNEAQTAREQAAIEQAKVNTALAQLALAQTAAEERHSMRLIRSCSRC